MAAHAADDKPGLSGDRPGDAAMAPLQDMNPLQRLIQDRLRVGAADDEKLVGKLVVLDRVLVNR